MSEELEPVFLSATQISNASLCLRKWAWDKIARIPREPSQALELGIQVHDILEAFYLNGTAPDVEKTYRFKPGSKLFYPGKIASGMITPLIPVKKLGDRLKTEMCFTDEELAGCFDIKYVGKIDIHWLEKNLLKLVDHKTSSDPTKWGKTEEDLIEDIQFILYSAAMIMKYPEIKHVEFTLNYGDTSCRYSKNKQPSITVDSETILHAYVTKIQPMAKYMAVQKRNKTNPLELEPNPEACNTFGGCSYKPHCNLTSAEKMRGFMKSGSKVAALLNKSKVTQSVVNPPENGAEMQASELPDPEVVEEKKPLSAAARLIAKTQTKKAPVKEAAKVEKKTPVAKKTTSKVEKKELPPRQAPEETKSEELARVAETDRAIDEKFSSGVAKLNNTVVNNVPYATTSDALLALGKLVGMLDVVLKDEASAKEHMVEAAQTILKALNGK